MIGRDPSCQVCEPDPLLSRRHAEIVTSGQAVSIRDLSSRNGVLVNGEKIREQALLPGDVVQIGHLQLRYVEEEPVQQPGRWTPEPTPLPGRADRLPPAAQRTPVPRGRAAFEQAVGPRPAAQAGGDATMIGSAPPSRPPSAPPPSADADATLFGTVADATMAAGDGTLEAAIAHLAALGQPRTRGLADGPRLVAGPDLTIVDATPECAEILGIAGESIVGDSLADIFLRGVRRAYADGAAALSFTITRDEHGGIAVTLALHTSSGHE